MMMVLVGAGVSLAVLAGAGAAGAAALAGTAAVAGAVPWWPVSATAVTVPMPQNSAVPATSVATPLVVQFMVVRLQSVPGLPGVGGVPANGPAGGPGRSARAGLARDVLGPPQVQALAVGGLGVDRGPACPAAAGPGTDRPVGRVVMGWSPRKLLR